MSYNVDGGEIVYQADFSIRRSEALRLRAEVDLPESSVIDQVLQRDDRAGTPAQLDPDEPLRVVAWSSLALPNTHFSWSGIWSGSSYGALVESVLPAFDGEADIVFCWEGGDSYSGLRLRNHVVTRHKVIMTLGEEEP